MTQPARIITDGRQTNGGGRKRERKTHCWRGHEFTPENTRYVETGRRCITCDRMNGRETYRQRQAEKAAASR